jgi:hypothetical protein
MPSPLQMVLRLEGGVPLSDVKQRVVVRARKCNGQSQIQTVSLHPATSGLLLNIWRVVARSRRNAQAL